MENLRRPVNSGEKPSVYRPPVPPSERDRETNSFGRKDSTERDGYQKRSFGGSGDRDREGGFGGRREYGRKDEGSDPNDKWSKAFKSGESSSSGTALRTNNRAAGFLDGEREERGERPQRDRGGAGGSAGGGERRFGGGRRGNDEEITDPRFASVFGKSNNNNRSGDVRSKYNNKVNQEQKMLEPLPTAPRGSLSSSGAAAGNSEEGYLNGFKIVEKNKNKKDKKKDSGSDNVAHETKETVPVVEVKKAAASAKEAEEKNTATTKIVTLDALKQGIKGTSLLGHIKSNVSAVDNSSVRASGVMLAIGENYEDLVQSKWWKDEECGAALKELLVDTKSQISFLFGLQQVMASRDFPSVEVKGAQKKVIDVLFNVLLAGELINPDGLLGWADAESEEVPGRFTALIQTTNLISSVKDLLMNGDGDDNDDDEDMDLHQDFIENKA